jgi:uncharacterized membrane protein YGL010W
VKSVNAWLAEYGESHEHDVNKAIHWICIPLIVFSLLGLLWAVPLPGLARTPLLNGATLLTALATIYYLVLSPPLALGMAIVAAAMLAGIAGVETVSPWPLWQVSLGVFVVAWAGQFAGHKIEGKKPSFFKHVQFLLIGPLWLLGAMYRRLGLRY